MVLTQLKFHMLCMYTQQSSPWLALAKYHLFSWEINQLQTINIYVRIYVCMLYVHILKSSGSQPWLFIEITKEALNNTYA